MFPVVGIVVLLLLVFGGFALTGGNLGPVMHALPHEMLIIGGAALGSLIIGNSGADLKALAGGLGKVDRKSVVEGKSVSVRVDSGGRRSIKKKTIHTLAKA